MTVHRFVLHDRVPDYLRLGWLALPSLEGTHHGAWSVHCAWLCDSQPIEPGFLGMSAEEWKREGDIARGLNAHG